MKKIVISLLFLVIPLAAMEQDALQTEVGVKQVRLNMGLMRASYKGEYEKVQSLLDHGAEVNPKGPNLWYIISDHPLSVAAYTKREDVCRLLLERGADVNKPDWLGKTPLFYAASVGGEDDNSATPFSICRLLIIHGADVNTQCIDGTTPYMVAVRTRDEQTVDLLKAHGAFTLREEIIALARNSPRKEFTSSERAYLAPKLIEACCNPEPLYVALLLAVGAHHISEQKTAHALLHAIMNNQIINCQLMMDHGVNPDVIFNDMTALMSAAQYRRAELCKLFLKHSNLTLELRPSARNIDLALHESTWTELSQMRKTPIITQLLLEHGANPNALPTGPWYHPQETLLLSAVRQDANHFIESLCQYGGDIELVISGPNGTFSAFSLAANNENLDLARKALLIQSRFPAITQEEIRHAQQRTRLRFWLLQKACPRALPKEVKALILSQEEDVWKDACCTPLRLLANQYESLKFIPHQVARILVANKALDLEMAICAIRSNKIAILKRLLTQHAQGAVNRVDPENLEQTYGALIEQVIRKDLIQIQDPENNMSAQE